MSETEQQLAAPPTLPDLDQLATANGNGSGASASTLPRIEGPSAFGGSRQRFWDLLWLTASQEFRMQYRTSILGYVWTLLRPLALFGVLYFIFTEIVKFGAGIANYPLQLLIGIMLFQFFADATGAAMSGMLRGENVIRKMHFPRMVIPLSLVLVSFMTAMMNLFVALIFVLCFGGALHWSWLLLPIPILALTVFTTGVSLLLCATYVKARDVGQIWNVILRALFYATPIIYPLDRVPVAFHSTVALNPLAPILTEAKNLIIPGNPGVISTVGIETFLGSVAIAAALCIAGLVMFVRQAPFVAERL